MSFHTASAQTNPAANAILADTGAFAISNNVDVRILVSSTVAAVIVFEHRNATDTANVTSHIFPVAANSPLVVHVANAFSVGASERLRLRLNAAIVGQCQGSMNIG